MPFLLQFSSFGKNRFKVFWLNLQLNRKTYSAVFARNLKISQQKRIRRQSLYSSFPKRGAQRAEDFFPFFKGGGELASRRISEEREKKSLPLRVLPLGK